MMLALRFLFRIYSCTTELNGYASMDCTSGIPDGNCDLSDTSKMIDPRCKYCPYQSQPYNISMMDRQYLDGVCTEKKKKDNIQFLLYLYLKDTHLLPPE